MSTLCLWYFIASVSVEKNLFLCVCMHACVCLHTGRLHKWQFLKSGICTSIWVAGGGSGHLLSEAPLWLRVRGQWNMVKHKTRWLPASLCERLAAPLCLVCPLPPPPQPSPGMGQVQPPCMGKVEQLASRWPPLCAPPPAPTRLWILSHTSTHMPTNTHSHTRQKKM